MQWFNTIAMEGNMSERYYNPFQGEHLTVPVSFRDDFNKYCGSSSNLDQTPFYRMVDMWFLALCVSIKKNLSPVDLASYSENEKYKIIDGSIFGSNPWRIQFLLLLGIAMSDDINIVNQPRKIMTLANSLAVAGLPEVIAMLKEGTDEPIWNLGDSIEALIEERNTDVF